jgi:hypothetical protein
MKKKLLIALLVLVVVVGAVSVLTSANQSQARRALAEYKAKLRARGEKLTFVELGYPFPVETNANLENFIAVADRLSARSGFPKSLDWMPYDSPGKVVAFWRTEPGSSSGTQSFAHWDQLGEDMKASAELLAQVRAELERLPRRFGWNHTNPFASNQPRNPFVQKRIAAQFLGADCLFALREDNLARAQSNLRALTQLAQLHSDDPTLISGMIRVAVSGLGLTATWHSLQADGWDDKSLASLQRDWEAVDLVKALENAVLGERSWGQSVFTMVRSDEADARNQVSLFFGNSSSSLKRQLQGAVENAFWRANLDADELFYLRTIQARLDTIRQLKTKASAVLLQREISGQDSAFSQEYTKPLWAYRHYFSANAIPNYGRAFEVTVQREGDRRMTITAIALKRFHLRHGRHPAALAELAPEFLAAELIDPWSGKTFHYRREADGTFTLYSVGMDGEDNGGDASFGQSASQSTSMWSGKDAVWPKPVFPPAE